MITPLLKFVGWFSIWDIVALVAVIGWVLYKKYGNKKQDESTQETPDFES
jgi:hypothetical protein